MRFLFIAAALFAVLLVAPRCASAQPDFSGLRLEADEEVWVIKDDRETRGRVKLLHPNRLVIAPDPRSRSSGPSDGGSMVEFTPGPRLVIDRRGDGNGDGAIWGMGVGALLMAVNYKTSRCDEASNWFGCALGYVAVPGIIGAQIDALHKGRTRVYVGTDAVGFSVKIR